MTNAAVIDKARRRTRRRHRIRGKIAGDEQRPRLSVYRSNRGLFVQLIDDESGRTLVAANWTEADVRGLKPMERAKRVGELVAERAKAAGVESCVFDRGGYKYHGRVKALADGAREAGLRF